jgi:hypothetical protein
MRAVTYRRILAAGLATGLLAGCGGSSRPDPGPSATASKHGIAAPQSPAPQSLLEQIVLQARDLPGWTGTPYQDDPADNQDESELLRCAGARSTDNDKVAEVNSSDFSLDQATISSNAASYRSQTDVDRDAALLHNPKFAGCYQSLVKDQLGKSLPAGTTIRSAKVTISPRGASDPANLAATATAVLTVASNGLSLTVYVDVAFITGPLIEAEVDAENVGTPVPAALRNKLVQAVAARAARG